MIKIGIFTTTRAEFGLSVSLIDAIKQSKKMNYQLFVGGTHLAQEYGDSISEIRERGYTITETFDYLLNGDDSYTLAKSCGIETMALAEIFRTYQPDFVCVLGDRFELLPIVLNAILFKKPIIHLYGGERTEGSMDEQIRHMVTKAAHIHFSSCQENSETIRQLGEPDWRVFTTGSLAIDHIHKNKKIPKTELFRQLDLDPKKDVALLTYHPATLEFKINPLQQIKNIFKALEKLSLQVVITGSNIDVDRSQIMNYINEQVRQKPDYKFFNNLGIAKYHSLIPHCKFVIGNSSSGILEVPYFKIPTINIGDRQKGRIQHPSIINTGYTVRSIVDGINQIGTVDYQRRISDMKFKFGDGHAAEKMVNILGKIKINEKLLRKSLVFNR